VTPGDDSLRLQARSARLEVASGALRGSALLALLLSVPSRHRDDWTDALLGIEALPPDEPNLPPGSVPYLPCGVEEILAVLRDAPIRADDVLVDLGSGLGRVALLVHLLSGARTHGIEIQEHLVRHARALCEELAVQEVSFVHANAAEVELEGSIFFLYAPFNGPMLTSVLRRLEDAARRRPIVVGTVGLELHGLAWLRPRASSHVSLSLYDSQ
jgi:hypothetical protein